MRRATWLPGGRLKERACDISCPASHRGPTASAIVPQRVRVSLLLLPEATPLLHRSPQPCRPARHPPVLPLSQSRQRAGPPSVHTCCGVCWQPVPRLAAPCRALPRLAAPCRAAHNRRPAPRVHGRLTLSGAETTWTSTATSSTRAQWVRMTAVASQTLASYAWCAAQRCHSTALTCTPT
jgi:hypothetical protein